MRDLPFTALLLVLNYVAADLESTLTTDGSGVSRVWLASYRLPDIDYKHPPEGCDNFDDICHLEKEGKLGLAIKSYEDRLDRCGVVGWSKLGHLGAGKAAVVSLRVTPCGKHVALKGSHNLQVIEHIKHDCKILLEINGLPNHPCAACFPEAYYLSNLTSGCYVEHVPSVPIATFLDHFNSTADRWLGEIKRVFSQGIDGLKALQAAGVQHNDLTFRNLLVRLPEDGTHRYHIVFIDFGGATVTSPDHASDPIMIAGLGNKGHTDPYSFACQFFIYAYPAKPSCRLGLPQPLDEEGTLHDFLVGMMAVFANKHSGGKELQPWKEGIADVTKI